MEVHKTSQEIVHEGWLIKSPPTKLWRAVSIPWNHGKRGILAVHKIPIVYVLERLSKPS